tara:strand:+ start:86 stop:1795 length:1710 start_codon:yes stop_codon:yes gene_type:complete
MAYTINKTDGTIVATVEDGILDTTTSLSLIGRNYQSYGEAFNENLVKLLENSASTTAPTAPLKGELWFDASASSLKVYNGSQFTEISIRNAASAPTSALATGTFWNDTTNDQLYMYDGTAFDLIGPIYKTSDGKSGWLVDEEPLSAGGTANVVSLYMDGTRVGILTKTDRTLSSTPSGFTSATLQAGLTLYQDTDSTTFRIHGTATNALQLGGSEASSYLVNNANQTTSGTFGVLNDSGISLGADTDATISIVDNALTFTQNNANETIVFKINKASTVTTALTLTDLANVRVHGDLQVDGSLVTTGASSSFENATLILNNDSPADTNLGAGLDIRGSTSGNNITFFAVSDGGPLRSSSGLSVASGKDYDIAGTSILSSTTLGSSVVTSSLTSVGALNAGSITAGFGDIDVGDSNYVAAGIVRVGAIIMPSTGNDDSSTRTQVDNFNDDAQLTSANPEKTLVSERAIKQYVDSKVSGIITDLVFSMDVSGLSNGSIATILSTLAPVANFPIGTKARIAAVSYSPTSTSSYSAGSIGNPQSVVTSTSLGTSRNNDLVFIINSDPAWAYSSG